MSSSTNFQDLIKETLTLKFFTTETAVENVPSPHILVASVYRAIGVVDCTEKKAVENWHSVSVEGSRWEFDHDANKLKKEQITNVINNTFDVTVGETPYIFPVIPEIAYFGQAARNRKGANPMNPGNYFLQIIFNYSKDETSFIESTEKLFNALKPSSTDDKIETFFSNEFENICNDLKLNRNTQFNQVELKRKYNVDQSFYKNLSRSKIAMSCIEDLNSLIYLKSNDDISHQAWLGLFESFLRLTLFNHTICTLNLSKSFVSLIIESNGAIISQEQFDRLFSFDERKYLKIAAPLKKYVKEICESHFDNNIKILWLFKEAGIDLNTRINSVQDCNRIIETIFDKISNIKSFIEKKHIKHSKLFYERSQDSSSLKNKKEFLDHVLRDRSSLTNSGNVLNDVSYLFKKNGAKNSPFILSFGPGMIILLTSLIFLKKKNSSVKTRLSSKIFLSDLNTYNFSISLSDISQSSLSLLLKSLGYIIDSPDNEGGIMIVKPLLTDF